MQFSWANAGFLCAALVFNTFTAPMVKLTQNELGGYDYNKWSVYVFAELIKLVVAVVCCFHGYSTADNVARKRYHLDLKDALQYAVPGFVFFVQNNLSFLALQHMNSSAFQLLMNTRIVTVAVLSVLVLRKSMNALEWASIVLLMVGAMQYELSGCDAGFRVDSRGLTYMFVIVICAAGGNVYTQKVMQRKMEQPLMVQNAMLYTWGVLFNSCNWLASASSPMGLFGQIGFIQVFSMVFYASYGLSISIILKRFGAITRTFINTAAICFTALIDVAFFGSSISHLELTTFVVIMMAVYSNTILAPNYNSPGTDALPISK